MRIRKKHVVIGMLLLVSDLMKIYTDFFQNASSLASFVAKNMLYNMFLAIVKPKKYPYLCRDTFNKNYKYVFMMTKHNILFVVMVNLLLQPLLAQSPYLPIGKTWDVCLEYYDYPDRPDAPPLRKQQASQNSFADYAVQTYTILGDTVINAMNYVKINSYSPQTKFFYLRQNQNKVYGRIDGWEEDILLADYDLKVGDEIQYGFFAAEPVLTVSSVELVTLENGIQAKRIRYDGNSTLEDIEYIGNNQMGYIHHLNRATLNSIQFDNRYSLMSCSDNGILLYNGEECVCNPSDAVENLSATTLVVFPNPVRDHLELQGLEQEVAVAIYDLSGQCLLRTASRRIDVSALSAGIYLLHALAADGKHYQTKLVKE